MPSQRPTRRATTRGPVCDRTTRPQRVRLYLGCTDRQAVEVVGGNDIDRWDSWRVGVGEVVHALIGVLTVGSGLVLPDLGTAGLAQQGSVGGGGGHGVPVVGGDVEERRGCAVGGDQVVP